MKKRLFFCHGFGFDADYWQHLAPYFINDECVFLDLGYFSTNPSKLPNANDYPNDSHVINVGIGHSLGLIKLLSTGIHFNRLIGLNSFVNFLGNQSSLYQKRVIDLDEMIRRFHIAPETTLKNLYKRCGASISDEKLHHLNKTIALADLDSLRHSHHFPSSLPILILGTLDDVVVPPELIHDNFDAHHNVTVKFHEKGLHGLGYAEAQWVYQSIATYISNE